MKKELYVVDDNGEIIDTLDGYGSYAKLSDGDRVLRKGVIQYLNDTTDIKYRFIKINPFVYDYISRKYPIINSLIKYIGYMDGILSYKNGKTIKIKDIYRVCGVSESTVKRQLRGLIQEDVVHKIKDNSGQYCLILNPWVAYVGRRIYTTLYDEFKSSKYKNQCEEWKK